MRKTKPIPSRSPWLFKLGAIVLAPLTAFLLLEGALRLLGYGNSTSFFQRVGVGQREYLVNNEDFSLRFFPPQLARWPGPIMIEASKPTNACRIFVLGESAARGEPEPPYSAARYMEALLRQRFPQTQFEVVNVAITAINSHVILPIARDCAGQQGDFWIIYMGNNEMVGPFGAATVFGAKATPASVVRLSLAVQKSRVGQLLMAAVRRLKGKDPNASWGGMKMFLGNQLRPDDPRKETVYRNFQRNLGDILQAGLNSGARVILNTVAVNLKDCPPFATLPDKNLAADQQAALELARTNGLRAQAEGRFAEAIQSFESAARIDPKRADIQFDWAECLLATSNSVAAAQHYQAAVDDDALPFRADSRINGIIREAGGRLAGRGLVLLDAAAILATNCPSGVPGAESFYEHVHFNFDGNYRLGLAWARQIAALWPVQASQSRSGSTDSWAAQEPCERRLGLSDWNREAVNLAVIERLHRPPLSGQANNTRRLADLEVESRRLRAGMNRSTEAKAKEEFIAQLARAPEDHWLHENYAEFLESCRDDKGAIAQWQEVRDLLPHGCYASYHIGRLLNEQHQWAEAETALRQALGLRRNFPEAWCELGTAHFGLEQTDAALSDYERAWRLQPDSANFCAFTAKALAKLNRHAEAMDRYREALRLSPGFWEVHFALAEELASASLLSEAEGEYEQVLRLQPGYAPAHLSAGVMLARLGRFDPALQQFAETLRLDPENKLAREYESRVQGWKQQRPRE